MSNITKYSEITFAGIAGAGIALATGTTLGAGVATSFLFEGKPFHAIGSFCFMIFDKEKSVMNAAIKELNTTDYSLKKIFKAAL
jgi:hypothetical protein